MSGICLGIFEGSPGSHRAAPEPMCLPTMTQVGHEHVVQCIRLVHADALRIAPQRQTLCGTHGNDTPIFTKDDQHGNEELLQLKVPRGSAAASDV